jgi:hypothetical protein
VPLGTESPAPVLSLGSLIMRERAAIDQNCGIGSLSNRITTLARNPPHAGRDRGLDRGY